MNHKIKNTRYLVGKLASGSKYGGCVRDGGSQAGRQALFSQGGTIRRFKLAVVMDGDDDVQNKPTDKTVGYLSCVLHNAVVDIIIWDGAFSGQNSKAHIIMAAPVSVSVDIPRKGPFYSRGKQGNHFPLG